tara:strand:- start:82 stop:444 length:363 start_codon:yes stop_codon:yes gene_type:complete
MKNFLVYAISFILIFITLSSKVQGFENESYLDKSQIIIANKYAERFCTAKADHYFDGLESEKTLRNSYYKFIGLQSEEMYSNDLYKTLINEIRDKCHISNEEERVINELITNSSSTNQIH